MNEKVLKCLYDIKLAIEEIDAFFIDTQKSYDSYIKDIRLRRAIGGNLEIIGEAMNRIFKEDPDYEIEHARRIVGLRNQIIHGYDSVSDENIWGIVINHIPNLKIEVDRLIQDGISTIPNSRYKPLLVADLLGLALWVILGYLDHKAPGRRIVAHDYFGIDAEEVWQIIKTKIPTLKADIKILLG